MDRFFQMILEPRCAEAITLEFELLHTVGVELMDYPLWNQRDQEIRQEYRLFWAIEGRPPFTIQGYTL